MPLYVKLCPFFYDKWVVGPNYRKLHFGVLLGSCILIISLGPVHVFKEQSLMNTVSEILFQTLFLSLKLQDFWFSYQILVHYKITFLFPDYYVRGNSSSLCVEVVPFEINISFCCRVAYIQAAHSLLWNYVYRNMIELWNSA